MIVELCDCGSGLPLTYFIWIGTSEDDISDDSKYKLVCSRCFGYNCD